jgi:hypothetical protein
MKGRGDEQRWRNRRRARVLSELRRPRFEPGRADGRIHDWIYVWSDLRDCNRVGILKPELIEKAPLDDALVEIKSLEASARTLKVRDLADALGNVVGIVEGALQKAANPDLGEEGIAVSEYARLKRMSKAAVYKQIKLQKLEVKRGPNGIRIVKLAS